MKRSVKITSLILGVVLMASSCAQRICPTYANVDAEETKEKKEATV